MWKRRIVLEILSNEDEVLLTLSDHRIDFTYFSLVGGKVADTCEVRVYNLGLPKVKFLADKTRKKNTALKVRIKAGHLDELTKNSELPTLIVGEIMGVSGQRVLPDHITTLYCVPSEGRVFNSLTQTIVAKEPIKLRDFITEFMRKLGEYTVSFEVGEAEEKVLDTIIKNYSDKGTIVELLNRLTKQHHLLYNLEDGILRVRSLATEEGMFKIAISAKKAEEEKQASTVREDGVVILPDVVVYATRIKIKELDSNLLRGTPTIGISTFSAVVSLDLSLRPLDILDVSKINGQDATAGQFPLTGIGTTALGAGTYRDKDMAHYTTSPHYQIGDLVHVGSNYTETWTTTINAFMYRDNLSDNGNRAETTITIS